MALEPDGQVISPQSSPRRDPLLTYSRGFYKQLGCGVVLASTVLAS